MSSGRARTPQRRAKRGVARAAIDAAIEAARKTAITRGGVAALRDAHGADAIGSALEATLEAGEAELATALALALAAHDRRIPEAAARRLLPDVERLEYIPLLVAHTDADPLALMEALLSQREQTVEADAVMAALAARSFQDGVPPRWMPLLRNLCLDALPGDDASLILGRGLADVAKDELAAMLVPHVGSARMYEYDASWIARHYESPLLECLPEQRPPKVIAEGFTLRRGEDAKVGRNDPCPCGSGKKFKKCCAAGGQGSAPSRSAGPDPARLAPQDLERMRPRDLVRLDPQKLSVPVLQKNLEQLAAFRRWREAERALDALSRRADPEVTNLERLRLVQRALGGGAFEVAERQQELLPGSASDDPTLQAIWAVARPSAESLATLDALIEEGLTSGEPDWFFDVAFALLDHAPALGIAFARGCMGLTADDERARESLAAEVQTLLTDVELTRSVLGLDGRDEAHEIHAALAQRARMADEHKSALAKAAKGDQKLRAALEEARAQLDQDRAAIASLEAKARVLGEELESARAAGNLDPRALEAERREARAKLEESEEDRRGLRARVEELKALLKESSEERAELRRELRRVAALSEEREAPAATAAREPAGDDALGDSPELPGQATRVPSIKKNAAEALLAMPAKVSRAALELIAALASGDAIAWRTAKRMQGVDDIWSARVGIHHRLLYRTADDALEVLELVTRESLDTVLMRYRRGA